MVGRLDTADRAVPVKQSKVVVDKLVKDGKDTGLVYTVSGNNVTLILAQDER